MRTLLFALISIGLSVASQFALKAGVSTGTRGLSGFDLLVATLSNTRLLCGFILYGISALFWLRVLSRWDVSKAYPLVGLGFGLAAFVGALIGERVTAIRVVGIALIGLGVVLVGRS